MSDKHYFIESLIKLLYKYTSTIYGSIHKMNTFFVNPVKWI